MSVVDDVKVMLLRERAKIDGALRAIDGRTESVAASDAPKASSKPKASGRGGKPWSPEHRANMMAARERSKARRANSFDHSPPSEAAE